MVTESNLCNKCNRYHVLLKIASGAQWIIIQFQKHFEYSEISLHNHYCLIFGAHLNDVKNLERSKLHDTKPKKIQFCAIFHFASDNSHFYSDCCSRSIIQELGMANGTKTRGPRAKPWDDSYHCYSNRAPTNSTRDDLSDHDSVPSETEQFFLFTTGNFQLLQTCAHWHVRRTFQCCPELFYQVFTIQGVFWIITRWRLS